MAVYPSLLLRLLLASLTVGLLVGMIYDVIRILRVALGISRYTAAASAPAFRPRFLKPKEKKKAGHSRVFSFLFLAIFDFFFCVIVGILLSVLLFYRNDGEFRGFVIVGVAVGFFVYYQTVGKLVIRGSEYVIFALRNAVLYLAYYTSWPVIAFGRFLARRVGGVIHRARARAREKRVARYDGRIRKEMTTLSKRGFFKEDWREEEKST